MVTLSASAMAVAPASEMELAASPSVANGALAHLALDVNAIGDVGAAAIADALKNGKTVLAIS